MVVASPGWLYLSGVVPETRAFLTRSLNGFGRLATASSVLMTSDIEKQPLLNSSGSGEGGKPGASSPTKTAPPSMGNFFGASTTTLIILYYAACSSTMLVINKASCTKIPPGYMRNCMRWIAFLLN